MFISMLFIFLSLFSPVSGCRFPAFYFRFPGCLWWRDYSSYCRLAIDMSVCAAISVYLLVAYGLAPFSLPPCLSFSLSLFFSFSLSLPLSLLLWIFISTFGVLRFQEIPRGLIGGVWMILLADFAPLRGRWAFFRGIFTVAGDIWRLFRKESGSFRNTSQGLCGGLWRFSRHSPSLNSTRVVWFPFFHSLWFFSWGWNLNGVK